MIIIFTFSFKFKVTIKMSSEGDLTIILEPI